MLDGSATTRAAALLERLVPHDQGAQPRRVDERHLAEVESDRYHTVFGEAHQRLLGSRNVDVVAPTASIWPRVVLCHGEGEQAAVVTHGGHRYPNP